MIFDNVMLDADAVINNSSQKVSGSNAYPDPAPKKWVGPDPKNTWDLRPWTAQTHIPQVLRARL